MSKLTELMRKLFGPYPSYSRRIEKAKTPREKIYWLLRQGPMSESSLTVALSLTDPKEIRPAIEELKKDGYIEMSRLSEFSPEDPIWTLNHW